MEIHKIPGFDGRYGATKDGKIWSFRKGRHNGKWLTQKTTAFGYRRVGLMVEGKQVYFNVHKLVAMTFIGPHKNGFEINHKNCKKDDNRVCNLEWVTKSDNAKHAWHNGKNKFTKNMLRAVRKNVVFAQIANRSLSHDEAMKLKTIYEAGGISQSALAKKFNVSQGTVSNIVIEKYYRERK